MKEIVLTDGKLSQVSDVDFEWLSQWAWDFQAKGYAARRVQMSGKRVTIYMHDEIMKPACGEEVDHRNGKGLDNQRENLRSCTHLDNSANRKVYKNNTSGYKGVTQRKGSTSWRTRIHRAGKLVASLSFPTALEAALAYDALAIQYYGEFARLNFPKTL